jgi:hypothetical protein
VKLEMRELAQHREPGLFQHQIAIEIDAVDADHNTAAFEHTARQAKSNKAGRAGDQDSVIGHSNVLVDPLLSRKARRTFAHPRWLPVIAARGARGPMRAPLTAG